MSEVGVGYVRLVPSMQGFSAAASSGMSAGLAGPAMEAGKSSGKGFVDGFGQSLQSGGKSISSAGDKLTLGLTAPILGLGAASFAASRDFNASMSNIGTLIPGNTDRVLELKSGMMDLSVQVGKSSGELADGMYNVISAFGDSSESMSLLDINARSATAGMATTTDAINLTSAVTKGYGDTSADAVQKASDLALLTVRLGQTTFPELASSIGQVIPFAQNLGVSQEELFATMAAFTGVTGSASEVATQMRGSMQALMAPTADAAAAIEAAGYSSGAAAIEELGFAGAVGILTDAADASGDPLQKYISSVEGQTVAMGLAGAQADTYEEKLREMAGAAGTTDEAFAEATEGVNAAGFQWEQAKAQAGNLAIQMGDGLAPALSEILTAAQPLVEQISSLAQQFADADPHTQKMILGAVGLVAALGPVMSIVGRVTSAVGGLIRGGAAFGRGIATIAKGGAKLATFAGRGAAALGRLGMAAGRAGLAVVRAGAQMIAAAVKATARVVASIATQIARWVVLGVQALLHAAKVALAWIISLGPLGILIAAVIAAVALIIANWDKVSAFITGAASWIWEHVTAIFTAIKDWVMARIDDIVSFFTALPDRIAGFITAIYDKHVEVFNLVKDWVSARIDDIVSFFAGIGERIWGFITAIYDKHVEVFNDIKDWVSDRIDDVVSFFTGLPGRVGTAISGIADKIKAPFETAFNGIKSLWNSTVGGFGFSVPSWIPGVGGRSFSIPSMHSGGIFDAPGGEGFAFLESGEGVFTQDQMAAIGSQPAAQPAVMRAVIDVTGADRDMARLMRRIIKDKGGGNVQVGIGQSRGGR